MVNSEDFIKRLEHLLDFYSLSASVFADKIGVQRSSISHLLSGRNKPSLDFMMKIMDEFPEVNLYWLLGGKGGFLKSEPVFIPSENTPEELFQPVEKQENPIPEETLFKSTPASTPSEMETGDSEIYKIVIFYKDGTFRDFIRQ